MTDDRFPYGVDAGDRVSYLSDAWLQFARENDAPALTADAVIGRPLWGFIAGKETRHLYGLVFASARAEQREVVVPFRCDGPTCLRYMELRISPRPDGSLDLTPRLIRAMPHPYVGLLDPAAVRSERVLRICSWCKRVLIEPGEWIDTEMAIRRLDLFDSRELPQLTHGVCDRCEADVAGAFES